MANDVTRLGGSSLMPLSEAMDQLFRDAFTWPRVIGSSRKTATLGMNSNLYDTDDGYVLQILVPGLDRDSINITANQNVLTLEGKMSVEAPNGGRVLWQGATSGEFRESMTLPGDVEAGNAEAEYTDGLLTLRLPKVERARAKTIKISPAGSPKKIVGK